MLGHVFRLHGFPKDVVSDRGLQFASRFWKAFCSLLGATVSLRQYHHQSNSQTERLNQELKTGLCGLVSQNPATWSRHLIWVEYAHSTLPCPASGLSLFQCAHDYQPLLFPVLEEKVSIPSAQAHSMLPQNLDWSLSGAASELSQDQEGSWMLAPPRWLIRRLCDSSFPGPWGCIPRFMWPESSQWWRAPRSQHPSATVSCCYVTLKYL